MRRNDQVELLTEKRKLLDRKIAELEAERRQVDRLIEEFSGKEDDNEHR